MTMTTYKPKKTKKTSSKGGMSPKPTLMLAISEPMTLLGLSQTLQKAGYKIVAETTKPSDLLAFAKKYDAAILLADSEMMSSIGERTGVRITNASPSMRILIYINGERRNFPHVMNIYGTVDRYDDFDEIQTAIMTVAVGQKYNPPAPVDPKTGLIPTGGPLSPRETEISRLISKGYGNREIAQELELSEQSIKNLVSRILHKLGATNRVQIALYMLGLKNK